MLRGTRTDRKISMWHRMQKNINQSATSIKILSCIISKLCTFVIKRVHCSYRIPITIQTTNYEKQENKLVKKGLRFFIAWKSVRSHKISKWHSFWQGTMVQIVAKKRHTKYFYAKLQGAVVPELMKSEWVASQLRRPQPCGGRCLSGQGLIRQRSGH